MSTARPPGRSNLKQWRSRGQGLVEYALILVCVVILIIVILTFIGQTVFINMYSRITSGMNQP